MPPAAATPGTVLVTGGAGYIGSHAVLALRDAGRPVAVIDTLATGFRWAVPDDVPFYHGDVATPELIDRIAAEQGVTAIMHFAGSLLVPESVAKPLDYYRNNVVASRSLIESAVRNGIPHFIFSSTAAVYGTPEVVPGARGCAQVADQPLWQLQADDRDDARRRRPRPSAELRHPALFQRRRGRSAAAQRAVGCAMRPT